MNEIDKKIDTSINSKIKELVEQRDIEIDTKNEHVEYKVYSPEWFFEKSSEFASNNDADELYNSFMDEYGVEVLSRLDGNELLQKVFISNSGERNLCYDLEFGKYGVLFGSIRSGTSFKYGLFFSSKRGAWVTGSARNCILLSVEEAIKTGTQIRDYLVNGAKKST